MRTLNDIVPPSRRKDGPGVPPAAPGRQPLRLSEKPARFPYTTLIITLLIIAGSIGALVYFSNASVLITPNTASAAVQGSFTAGADASQVPYQVITAQKEASQTVTGSGTRTVNSPASGMITIYNEQSKPQSLVGSTRFATASGLVFRIRTAVTIPAGSSGKPGSVSARVYADQPGATYNIGPTSFTVPGFAGTPQASQVYARSTAPMTGGASGTVPAVDPAVSAEAEDALVSALGPDLAKSIEAEVPAGYILLPGSATTTYQALTPAPAPSTGEVVVRVQGTVTAVVFPNAALAKAIASSLAGLDYQGEPVTLGEGSDLRFSAAALPETGDATFSFTLSGSAALVYTVDPSRIAAAVSGKSKSAAEVALTSYPEVKRAVLTLRPFWRSTFPEDPSAIKVTVEEPEN